MRLLILAVLLVKVRALSHTKKVSPISNIPTYIGPNKAVVFFTPKESENKIVINTKINPEKKFKNNFMGTSFLSFTFKSQKVAHIKVLKSAKATPKGSVDRNCFKLPLVAITTTPEKLIRIAVKLLKLIFCFRKGMDRITSVIGQR